MERYSGKVALVTGVSSGIGEDIAKALVNEGMKVVGVARRTDRILKMEQELKGKKGVFKAIKCDIRNLEEIKSVFQWIEENWGGITVLVNNAGVATQIPLTEGDMDQVKMLFETNVIGLTAASREAVVSMKKHNIDGHIININSVVGHIVLPYVGIAPYSASKHAVTVLTQSLRRELSFMGQPKIRVTSISPGVVKSEMSAKYIEHSKVPSLDPKDISDCVKFVLGSPQHVNITELTVQPTSESLLTSVVKTN